MKTFYAPPISPRLPWEYSHEEVVRFRKILGITLLLALLFGLFIPWIDVPEDDRFARPKVPERLVKLVLEQKKVELPPPPPPKEEEKEEPEPEPEPEPDEPEPEPEKAPEPEPEPVPEPEVAQPTAKEAAEAKAAVFSMFDDVSDNSVVDDLTDSSELSSGGAEATETQRAVIGDSALADSGGINVSAASRSKGRGGSLKGKSSTAVKSKIQTAKRKAIRANGGAVGGRRTGENIQLTFDRNQGSIFTAYNRALRKNPSLQGRVVFKLTILPSGKVQKVTVVSSELNDPKLERRLIAAIKRLNFGKLGVAIWEGNYPIVFSPQN